jgi:mitofilin
VVFVFISGRAQRQRFGCHARDLWLACNALLTVVKEGIPGDLENGSSSTDDCPTPVTNELNAVRDAGSIYPLVHITLSSIPPQARTRGVYTPEALTRRFDKVRRVARRVTMIDETGATLARYVLSYLQSFFVVRAKPVRNSDTDVSELSAFALLDNADDCLRRGDLEQAARYVNQLRGESRRVAADWLAETRLLLETRQAAVLLLAFASANGLDSLD